jgi:hypothetical protein
MERANHKPKEEKEMDINEIAEKLFNEKNPKTKSEVEKAVDSLPYHSSQKYIELYGDIDPVDLMLALGKIVRKQYFADRPRIEWFRS